MKNLGLVTAMMLASMGTVAGARPLEDPDRDDFIREFTLPSGWPTDLPLSPSPFPMHPRERVVMGVRRHNPVHVPVPNPKAEKRKAARVAAMKAKRAKRRGGS